jgi:hypothetical protein
MLKVGPALRVVIHLNEDIGSREDYLYNEIFAFLHSQNVAGATLFRPHAGFGLHHRLHTQGASGPEGKHLPIRIDFVEDESKVEALLPGLFELLTDGLIEVQETTVLKIAGNVFGQATEGGSSE